QNSYRYFPKSWRMKQVASTAVGRARLAHPIHMVIGTANWKGKETKHILCMEKQELCSVSLYCYSITEETSSNCKISSSLNWNFIALVLSCAWLTLVTPGIVTTVSPCTLMTQFNATCAAVAW